MEELEKKYPNYRLPVVFNPKLVEQAYKFLEFIKAVGEKHGLSIRYRTYEPGRVVVIVPRSNATKFDTTLQELIMMRGLHYYAMSLTSQRIQIIEDVIVPIYEWLIEGRFENSNSKYIRQHILAEISPSEYVPVDYENEFSSEYEILYRKWVLGTINDSEFILELDSLMTRFLLTQTGHKPGTRSQQFNQVLAFANIIGVGMDRTFRKIFEKVHHTRKQGLHQLSDSLTHEEITEIALRLMTYFQYYDEFSFAQKHPEEMLHSVQYSRIRYGDEDWRDENDEPYKDRDGTPYDHYERASKPCGDCAAVRGQLHVFMCDIEQCPRCKGQRLSCDCMTDSDIELSD
jgi:hypothetical protein